MNPPYHPRRQNYKEAGARLRQFLLDLEQELDLSDVEMLALLGAAVKSYSGSVLVGEWFPDDRSDAENDEGEGDGGVSPRQNEPGA